MPHTITNNIGAELTIEEANEGVFIIVKSSSSLSMESVLINKDELRSFIGTLLHIQAKMRGGK